MKTKILAIITSLNIVLSSFYPILLLPKSVYAREVGECDGGWTYYGDNEDGGENWEETGCGQGPRGQEEKREPQLVQDGPDCRGRDSCWIRRWDDGREEAECYGETPGQCGVEEQRAEEPAPDGDSNEEARIAEEERAAQEERDRQEREAEAERERQRQAEEAEAERARQAIQEEPAAAVEEQPSEQPAQVQPADLPQEPPAVIRPPAPSYPIYPVNTGVSTPITTTEQPPTPPSAASLSPRDDVVTIRDYAEIQALGATIEAIQNKQCNSAEACAQIGVEVGVGKAKAIINKSNEYLSGRHAEINAENEAKAKEVAEKVKAENQKTLNTMRLNLANGDTNTTLNDIFNSSDPLERLRSYREYWGKIATGSNQDLRDRAKIVLKNLADNEGKIRDLARGVNAQVEATKKAALEQALIQSKQEGREAARDWMETNAPKGDSDGDKKERKRLAQANKDTYEKQKEELSSQQDEQNAARAEGQIEYFQSVIDSLKDVSLTVFEVAKDRQDAAIKSSKEQSAQAVSSDQNKSQTAREAGGLTEAVVTAPEKIMEATTTAIEGVVNAAADTVNKVIDAITMISSSDVLAQEATRSAESSPSANLAPSNSIPQSTAIAIELNPGWNLVTLAAIPQKPLTAKLMLQNIVLQGGYATTVSTLQNGAWKSYVVRGVQDYSGGDFVIEPGKAYFIKSLQKSIYLPEGLNFAAPVKVNVRSGWNAVGFPFTENDYDASKLIDKMNTKGVDADSIARWESGLWDTFIKKMKEEFGNNFVIVNNRGYLLRAGKGVQFSP